MADSNQPLLQSKGETWRQYGKLAYNFASAVYFSIFPNDPNKERIIFQEDMRAPIIAERNAGYNEQMHLAIEAAQANPNDPSKLQM